MEDLVRMAKQEGAVSITCERAPVQKSCAGPPRRPPRLRLRQRWPADAHEHSARSTVYLPNQPKSTRSLLYTMITRSARKLETTLVSYSRQRLPRPARYSTPTKRAQAPALAQAPAPLPDYPAYMPPPPAPSGPLSPMGAESLAAMESFLKRAPSYTVLPTPEPDAPLAGGQVGGLLFTDTNTQDRLAFIDACLHNLQDVPRAKHVFDTFRAERPGDSLLSTRLYNQILAAYVRMAEEREPEHRALWVEQLWTLFHSMSNNTEKIRPDPGTFAIMLIAWIKLVSFASCLTLD
jgi:DNA-directed RNA polymerase